MQYFDKNGVEIKAGMTIRMEDGSLELVYDTTDSYGNPDLGINASNEEYLELHPFASREFYSLCNFDMRYLASQLPLYIDPMFRLEEHIQGICVTDADLYMPIDEAKAQLHDVRFTIPYSRAVKQQMLDGNLYEVVNDKKFNDKFKAIVEKVV